MVFLETHLFVDMPLQFMYFVINNCTKYLFFKFIDI